MFKILVLQALYSLSDEATEFQIKDGLSFQRFLGLALLWQISTDHSSPSSTAVRAFWRRRLAELDQDRLSDGWECRLRRRARASFFSDPLP